MIAFLNGKLILKNPENAVVDCNGVGYEIKIPLSTYDKLPEIGENLSIFIYYSFNENDGARLYGFFAKEEKQLFKQLINVSKIGPKTALTILSGLAVHDLIGAIQTGDISLLSTISGIGKKSAERLVIELKDRVGNINLGKIFSDSNLDKNDQIIDAESALTTLGYKKYEIRKVLSN